MSTYTQRLERYRHRLVSEIDREIRTISGWMREEAHDDMRDGYRERVAALEREKAEIRLSRSV